MKNKGKKFVAAVLAAVLFMGALGLPQVHADDITRISTLNDLSKIADYDYMIVQDKVKASNTTYTMTGDWAHFSNVTVGQYEASHVWGTSKSVASGGVTTISGTLTLTSTNCVMGSDGKWYNLKLEFSNAKFYRPAGIGALNDNKYLISFISRSGLTDALSLGTYSSSGLKTLGSSVDIKISIVDSTGKVMSGSFPYVMTDLDIRDRTVTTSGSPSSTGGGPYAESVQFVTTPEKVYLGTPNQDITVRNGWSDKDEAPLGRVITSDGNYRFYQATGTGSTHLDYPNGTLSQLSDWIDYSGVLAIIKSGSTVRWTGSMANSFALYPFQAMNGSVTVKYITDTGKVLEAQSYVQKDKPVGTSYSTTQKTFTDYHFKQMQTGSAPASGIVMKGLQNVVYVYEHDKGTVDVVYKTTTGKVLEAVSIVKNNVDTGTTYTTAQKTFTGYTFKQMDPTSAPASGTVKKGTQHVIYLYEENGSVDVTYQDTNGNKLEATSWVKQNVAPGTAYTTTQKTFKGYTFKQMASGSAAANGTVESGKTKHVIYVYEKNKYKITTSVIGGTIDPSVDAYYNDNVTINHSPNEGYYLDSMEIDGKSVTPVPNAYTFNNIEANHHIHVVYKIKKFNVTTSVENGYIDPSEVVEYGNSTIKTYTPLSAKYALRKILVDGVDVDITQYPAKFSFINIKAHHSIHVKYEEKPIVVTYESDEGGEITGTRTEWRDIADSPRGSTQKDKAMHRFSHWVANKPVTLKDGLMFTAGSPLTMENIYNVALEESITFTAIHEKLFNVNYVATEGGEVTGKTYEIRSEKENPTGSTAEEKPGYRFLNWEDEEGNPITMEEIQEITLDRDRTFTARFEKIPNVTISKTSDKESYNTGDEITWTVTIEEVIEGAVANNVVIKDTLREGTMPSEDEFTFEGIPNMDEFTFTISEKGFTAVIEHLPYGKTVNIIYKTIATSDITGDKIINDASVSWNKGEDKDTSHNVPRVVVVNTKITNGEITPPSGNLPYGSDYSVTYKPNEGYYITEIRVNGIPVDIESYPNGYEFSNLKDNEDIEVLCERIPYTIETEVINGEIQGGGTVLWGADEEILYNPNDGCQLVFVEVDGKKVDGFDTSYIFQNIKENHKIKVVYEKIPALEIAKKADKESYNVNDTVTYEVTIKQTVPSAEARDVIICDTLPEGLIIEKLPEGAKATENGYELNIPSLTEEFTFTYECKIVSQGAFENIVTAKASNSPDEPISSALINAFIPIPEIEKEADRDIYEYGDTITWTIKAMQKVPGAILRDAYIEDVLPEGAELLSIEGDYEKIEGDNIYLGTLSDQKEVIIKAKVVKFGGSILNIAKLHSKDGPTVEGACEVKVKEPLLYIEKTAENKVFKKGDKCTWTISLKAENTKAINPVVTDFIPNALALNKESITVTVNGSPVAAEIRYQDNLFKVELPDFIGEAVITYETEILVEGGIIGNIALFTSDNNLADMKKAEANIRIQLPQKPEVPEEPETPVEPEPEVPQEPEEKPEPPKKPEKPEEPKETPQKEVVEKEPENPKTGDQANTVPYIALGLMSILGCAILRHKKRAKQDSI